MANNTQSSDSLSERGLWWLPHVPDRKVPGTIFVNLEGQSNLELDGVLWELPCGPVNLMDVPLVFGATVTGKSYSLLNVQEVARQSGSHRQTTSKCVFGGVFIGGDHIDPVSQGFESASFHVDGLEEWLDREHFLDIYPDEGRPFPCTTTLTEVPSISFDVPAIDSTVSFESSYSFNPTLRERVLGFRETVRLTPREKRDYQWYLMVVDRMRAFFSLLVGDVVGASLMKFTVSTQPLPNGPGVDREELDFHVRKRSGRGGLTDIQRHEVAFRYSALAADFPRLFNNWFEKAERLSTTYELHLGLSTDTAMPLSFRFLALLQALESYHRCQGDEKYLDDAAYEPVKEAIIRGIPGSVSSDHRDALTSKIKYGNEFSLRKRLSLTLDTAPRQLKERLTGRNTRFISRVVDTRNYLTHRDESLRSNSLDSPGIHKANIVLRTLLSFLLLREIGIDAGILEHTMCNHYRYSRELRLLR